jgi:hypothetical protein
LPFFTGFDTILTPQHVPSHTTHTDTQRPPPRIHLPIPPRPAPSPPLATEYCLCHAPRLWFPTHDTYTIARPPPTRSPFRYPLEGTLPSDGVSFCCMFSSSSRNHRVGWVLSRVVYTVSVCLRICVSMYVIASPCLCAWRCVYLDASMIVPSVWMSWCS